MRLMAILLLAATQSVVSANVFSQGVTLSEKNATLGSVLNKIKKQTGFKVWYEDRLLDRSRPVTITVSNVPVEMALAQIFSSQPLGYEIIDGKIIALNEKESNPPTVITVRGRITNEMAEPVIASVTVKGTKIGTTSNSDGYFELKEVDENAVLVISGVSIETREVKVNGRVTINISAKIKAGEGEEIVVAYRKTTARANTGAVSVIKGEQIQALPNRSFDKSLQGFVPGLLVTSGTGQPGSGTSNFVLRGIATSASAENGSTIRNPLIVVDGVPVTQETAQLYADVIRNTVINNPLAQLNTSDIESITVLKDAAAIALYGAKSSNGVILITTKKGKAGKTQFNYRHQTDLAKAVNNRQALLSQQEYIDLLAESLSNLNPYYADKTKVIDTLKRLFPTRSDGSFYPAQDWEAALYKSGASTISNELSMSGGSDKVNYYLNLEYTKQHGVVKNTGLDRKSMRLNFENRPATWLRLGVNTTISYTIQNYGGALRQGGNEAASYALEISPLIPIRLENGDYVLNFPIGGGGTRANLANPVAAMDFSNINKNTAFRGLSKVYADVDFLKRFRFSTIVGVDFMLAEAKEKADPRLEDPEYRIGGRVEERSTRRSNFITTNILRYNNSFGNDHGVELLAGQEAQVLYSKTLSVGVRGLTSPYYDQITSPGVTVFRQDGFVLKETLLSYFGQANYGFKNRYFATASIRTDGSSRFGEDKRFGTYWSTGAGWVISSETFMERTAQWLNFLKIRGSIGAAGNAGAIDRFTPYDRLQIAAYLGNPAVAPSGAVVGNRDVKWERTFNWDAGIEMRFLKQRLSITADVYKRMTSDLIYSIAIPNSTGYTNILANIGKMTNKGIEVSVSADLIRSRQFRWHIDGNWSTNKNTLVKANTAGVIANGSGITASQEGKPFDAFYMRRWAGVNPADGTAMWIDSTGKPNSNYNVSKPEFVGSAQPDGFGAVTNIFSMKHIELSVMFYYQYGGMIYNTALLVRDGFAPFSNQSRLALNRWQKPGDIAENPKPVFNNSNPASRPSTRFLLNGDHVRLHYARIGYDLSDIMRKKVHLNGLRVFVQGNNLALWRKNDARDPSGVNVGGQVDYRYPSQRTFSIGLNAAF